MRKFLLATLLISAVSFALVQTASSSTISAAPVKDSLHVTITIWKDSAIGAIYNKATQTVAYGKPDKNNVYHIYVCDTNGNNVKRLVVPGWREDRQQWAEEWTPDGQYLFCYVEKSEYVKEKGHKRKPVDAIPGYGGYTDLWVIKRDGSRAWRLTDLPNKYSSGLIHAAISHDGKMFAYTERIGAPKFGSFNLGAGSYVFRVADIVTDSFPHLINTRTFQPGGIEASGELDGISPDNTTLVFYSTFESKNILATPLYSLNMVSGKITKLTTESFSQAPAFTPDGKHIVYMTGDGADRFPGEIQGADWWIMNPDGTEKERLTWMNKKNHPQSINHYRLAGCLSFMSDHSFLGGVMVKPLGLIGYTAKVTFH